MVLVLLLLLLGAVSVSAVAIDRANNIILLQLLLLNAEAKFYMQPDNDVKTKQVETAQVPQGLLHAIRQLTACIRCYKLWKI